MGVNRDIFIRTMCLEIVFSCFTARSASSDTMAEGEETILAVNSLLMQFFMFFSFLIVGFAHAAEVLTGKFIGVILVPLVSFTAFLWDGIYIGATAGREMRNAMLVSTLLVFFPAYILMNRYMGNHGLWLAFILFMLSRGITMSILARRAVLERV